MFFESDCQLGFGAEQNYRNDPLFDGIARRNGANKQHVSEEYQGIISHNTNAAARNNVDLDSVATDRQQQNQEEYFYEAGYRQEAAIRMASQKKVSFQQEQLAFSMNVDNTGMFAGEQPAPITVVGSNPKRSGRSKSKDQQRKQRSLSAKKITRPPSSAANKGKLTYAQKQTNKYKKSIDTLNKKIGAKDNKAKPQGDGNWNDSTTTGKYFDVNVDQREKRAAQTRQNNNDSASKLTSQAAKIFKASGNAIQVKTLAEEPGKFNIEFQNASGATASAMQIYQNIDQLVSDNQKPNYALLNYKVKNTPEVVMPQRRLSPAKVSRRPQPGQIDIADPEESYDDDIESVEDPASRSGKKSSHLRQLHLQNKQETQQAVQSILQHSKQDQKINSMIGEALSQKEGLIEELEKELAVEKTRREQMNCRFEQQMKEFTAEQRAVQGIRKANKEMENGKRDKSLEAKRLMKDEYDMVPTRLKPVSATANGMTFTTQVEPKQKPLPTEARLMSKKMKTTYDPSRVKSSIPGAAKPQPAKQRKNQQQAANYIEELKMVEMERAVKLESEQQMTQEIFERMRDNPNAELFQMHNEVSMLNRKIEPILKRVELASERVKQTKNHGALSSQPGPVGMLSKMAGRLITFYSDDLSALILEDILSETVADLQKIETLTRKQYAEKETEAVVNNILGMLAEYQAEEQKVDMRYSNKAVQRELQQLKLGEFSQQPKTIEIDLNQDYCELSIQEPEALSKQAALEADDSLLPLTGAAAQDMGREAGMSIGQSYQNPFERSKDFAAALTSQTKTGKAVKIAGAIDPEKAGLIKRKWRIDIDKAVQANIEQSRENWNKWLKEHNNTNNKKVWEVYDHLAADLTKEVLNEMMGTIDKDLDSYCEKVIIDEFQLE